MIIKNGLQIKISMFVSVNEIVNGKNKNILCQPIRTESAILHR